MVLKYSKTSRKMIEQISKNTRSQRKLDKK